MTLRAIDVPGLIGALAVVLALATQRLTPALAEDTTPEARADQLYRVGLDESTAGNCKDAVPTLRQGIAADSGKTNTNTPTAYFVVANCEVVTGDLKAAIDDYGAAIALKPDYELAYVNRARIRDRLGDDVDALDDMNRAFSFAIGALANDPTLYTTRGMIHYALKQPQAALGDIDEAIHLSPDDRDAYLDRAIVELSTGDLTSAREDATKVLADLPKDAKALEVRGVAESKLGDYSAAIDDLTSSMSFGDRDASVFGERAVAYIKKSRFADAKADLDRAIAIGPAQPTFYYDRALAKFSLTEYRAALVDADAAIAAGEKDPQAFTLRGDINEELGDQADAFADFNSAVAEDAHNGDHYYDRGYAHYKFGEDAASIADAGRAIALHTTKPAYWLRALVEARDGQSRPALADFNEALAQDPGNADALMRRGVVKEKLHDRSGAIADERAAVKLAKMAGDAATLKQADAQLARLGVSH